MPTVRLGPNWEPGRSQSEGLIQDGPTLSVRIGHASQFARSISSPGVSWELYSALIDTGSDENFIDISLAQTLALPLLREAPVAGVHGVQRGLVFDATIHIPELDFTFRGSVFGSRLAESGLPYAALLGRAFLQHVVMRYDGRTGEVTVSTD